METSVKLDRRFEMMGFAAAIAISERLEDRREMMGSDRGHVQMGVIAGAFRLSSSRPSNED